MLNIQPRGGEKKLKGKIVEKRLMELLYKYIYIRLISNLVHALPNNLNL